ncbi:MAG: 1-acyl-sn-glycerol-3-phosphate acyltransferase [Hyphomicrobiales bacterium]|nr:1-acyl-sn-glycerol-3-phosphate acyltransferase [Hyphomicrobiales bacterium]
MTSSHDGPAVLLLRSILFNLLFYLSLAAQIVVVLPTLVMPRRAIIAVAKFWARTNLWLLRTVSGIHVEFRGLEKIPPGPLLVSAKHQSTWETFALLPLLRDPAYIMKRELMWIPFFGWYTWKAGMIPVDRSRGSQALAEMNIRARQALAADRQIIIFPEGTRRPPRAEPRYKHGVAHLYAETAAPCLPIALNSGLFWPRRSIFRYPGTIRVEVLDPIPPGLDKEAFLARLQQEVETATTRLVARGEQELSAAGIRDFSGASRHREA